jgi:hypothetical protein
MIPKSGNRISDKIMLKKGKILRLRRRRHTLIVFRQCGFDGLREPAARSSILRRRCGAGLGGLQAHCRGKFWMPYPACYLHSSFIVKTVRNT